MMRQLSLLSDTTKLAGVMDAIKAAMRVASEGEGRKALPDKLNAIAKDSGVRLTAGNKASIKQSWQHKACIQYI